MLREEILKLPVGYPIIVRSSSGNFESYLLFLSESDETAGVVGDDGSPEIVKWSQLELHADSSRVFEAVPSNSKVDSISAIPNADNPNVRCGQSSRLYRCRPYTRNDPHAEQQQVVTNGSKGRSCVACRFSFAGSNLMDCPSLVRKHRCISLCLETYVSHMNVETLSHRILGASELA